MARAAILLILLILPLIYYGSSRSIKEKAHHLNLIADGRDQVKQSQVLELDGGSLETVSCEPIYGFLPCTSTLWGYLFLLVVYEVLLSLSQQYISSGSNLFFQMFGTGIFGASLFHILGIFPQIILVIVLGVSQDTETIESMAALGMSILAGTAIMMLTLNLGSVVAFGSYDLSDTDTDTAASNSDNNKPFSFTGYGVKTDIETTYTARIMLLSMIPILILQLAKILNSTTATRVVVLISLIISLVFLISYLTYQIFEPWIQNRRLEYVLNKYVEKKLLHRLLAANGRPNIPLIKALFHKIDRDRNASVSSDELRAFILGLQVEEIGLHEEDFVAKVMEEFNISADSNISETEFVNGLSKWLINNANNSNKNKETAKRPKLSSGSSKKTGEENQSLLADQKEESTTSSTTDKHWWNYTKAAFLVSLGTAITILLGKPLMETVQEFSSAANIPSFFISYVVIPLALNYKQVLIAIKSTKEKSENASSLTFSEIYGAVFMNNVMGLAIFLLLVYIRDLTWDVSAEVLVVLIICTAMGVLGSVCTKIPFWVCIIVYLLYPISLVQLYVLTEVLGWS